MGVSFLGIPSRFFEAGNMLGLVLAPYRTYCFLDVAQVPFITGDCEDEGT
jgi:hypothetical protein